MKRPRYRLDHIAIQTRGRQGLAAEIVKRTGLPDLVGYSVSGAVQSRGVRFRDGGFLDVFEADRPGAAVILGGDIDHTARLAEAQGWAARVFRQETPAPGAPAYPWSMVHFRRGQGLLTYIGVIAYATDPAAWAHEDFSGPLYRADPGALRAAVLSRVWLSAQDLDKAERDLFALGYARAGEANSSYWPFKGVCLRGEGADLVLCAGDDGVARIDIDAGGESMAELIWPEAPRIVFDERL